MSADRDQQTNALAAALSRRAFLANLGASLGALAWTSLLAREGRAAPSGLHTPGPHFPPRAKSVIYLHMAGSPSHIDLFDPKPALQRWDGKPCPQEFLEIGRASCRERV